MISSLPPKTLFTMGRIEDPILPKPEGKQKIYKSRPKINPAPDPVDDGSTLYDPKTLKNRPKGWTPELVKEVKKILERNKAKAESKKAKSIDELIKKFKGAK